MSGPKSADYAVVDNRALEAAARAQAWAAAAEIEARLQTLTGRARKAAGEYGIAAIAADGIPARPSSAASTSDIEQFAAALRAAFSRFDAQIERAIVGQQTARMLAALAVGVSGKVTTAEAALSGRVATRQVPEGGDATIDSETRHDRIQRALERLQGIVSQSEREAIQNLAREAIGVAEKLRFENLALELQYRIQRANEAARVSQIEKERAAQLLVPLRGLTGSDVDEITRELRQAEVGEGRLGTSIEERVQVISQAARRRADRDYAGRVIREEFERLGYQIEEGFQTIFVNGGSINLRKPDLKEYRARIHVSAEQERLDFQVVRAGSPSDAASQERRTRDKEIEDQWCGDLSQVMAAIKKRSVQSRITHRIPSGTQPVLVVDAEGGADQRREEDDRLASRQA